MVNMKIIRKLTKIVSIYIYQLITIALSFGYILFFQVTLIERCFWCLLHSYNYIIFT